LTVLAIDPGKSKCGVALVDQHQVLFRAVLSRSQYLETVKRLLSENQPEHLIVGGSTASKEVIAEVRLECKQEVTVVDERHTTERARGRYFQDHPPKGLWKLVPLGLQVPSVPVDDYAAVVMAEDFLSKVGG
jgi:RNase H-fold protein (predicted Holliday junction resolvase)